MANLKIENSQLKFRAVEVHKQQNKEAALLTQKEKELSVRDEDILLLQKNLATLQMEVKNGKEDSEAEQYTLKKRLNEKDRKIKHLEAKLMDIEEEKLFTAEEFA